MTQWHEPVSGFQYQTHSLDLSAQTQAERLTACGIDPAIFDDDVDPAFFIGLAIHAGIDSGISAEGNINMLQRLIQHRPAKLGEMLTVKGEIKSVTTVPRGQRVATDVWFEDTAGERVISCPRTSLRPQAQTNANSGAGDKPRPVVDELAVLTRVVSVFFAQNNTLALSSGECIRTQRIMVGTFRERVYSETTAR